MSTTVEPTAAVLPLFAELRRAEYGRLDTGGQVYLDHTGASLCGGSQLEEHLALLRGGAEFVELADVPHDLPPRAGR